MADYDELTSDLKDLLKRVENSGEKAWRIGKKLKTVLNERLYKSKYDSFDKYTRTEFQKSDGTVRAYIKIYESFEREIISQGDFLVTHLIAIMDNSSHGRSQIVLEGLMHVDKRVKYTAAIIERVTDVLNYEEHIDEEMVKELVEATVSEEKIAQQQISTNKKRKFGKPLKCPRIPEIEDMFLHEPLHEMGTVALFCTIFPYLRKMPFQLNTSEKNQCLLVRIKWVATMFPDALLYAENLNSRGEFDLPIEFEYESYNYIRHNHHKSSLANTCDLIVCWKDNLKGRKSLTKGVLKSLPPVLELSQVLRDGYIKVIRH